jgi:hypothetical protein
MNIKVVKNLPSELSIINVSGKVVLEKNIYKYIKS